MARIQEANRLVKNSCRIMREAIKLGIPWVVENPKTSRLWLTPQMQRFVGQGAFQNEVHFCQFGELWRKATYLFAWNLTDFGSISKICGGIPGICSRTGERHKFARHRCRRSLAHEDRTTLSMLSVFPDCDESDFLFVESTAQGLEHFWLWVWELLDWVLTS